jgi:cell division protein FtsL
VENLQLVLTIAGSLILVIVALAAVLVFVRGAYGNARIQALREDNEDLRARVADTESERDIFKTRVESLSSENTILRDLTLQRANVEQLKHALLAHNAEEMDTLKEYTDLIIHALEEHDRKAADQWEKVLDKLEERKRS